MILGIKPFLGLIAGLPRGVEFVSLTAAAGNVRSTLPANQKGDLMFVFEIDAADSFTADQPAGWATLGGKYEAYGGISGAYKVSEGGETGTVYSNSITDPSGSWVLILRGGWGSVPAILDSEIEFTSGNPPSSILNASTIGTEPKLALCAYMAVSAGFTPSYTGDTPDDTQEASNGSGEYIVIKWNYYDETSAGADITVDMADEGSDNGYLGFIMELA